MAIGLNVVVAQGPGRSFVRKVKQRIKSQNFAIGRVWAGCLQSHINFKNGIETIVQLCAPITRTLGPWRSQLTHRPFWKRSPYIVHRNVVSRPPSTCDATRQRALLQFRVADVARQTLKGIKPLPAYPQNPQKAISMFAARLSRTAIGQARNSRIPPQRSKLLFPGPRLPQTPLQTHRYHRYQRFGQGDSSSYSSSRFGWLSRWAASPYFYHQIGGGGLVLALGYTANLESVPVTGRRRFNVISKERERQLGKSAYEGIMRAHRHEILPEWDPRTRTVRRVLDRLVPAAGLGDFEAYVIDDPDEKNAFVIPGNKVFVFTGILPICHDEAGLASVLGHEIAHNVARHSAERLSQSLILVGVWLAVSLAFGTPDSALNLIWTYAFERPGSRKQEVTMFSLSPPQTFLPSGPYL